MKRAFTLIELTVILGMLATLMSVSIVSLLRSQQSAYLSSTSSQFITDLRSQQIRSMTGDTENSGLIGSYGIYIQPSSYTVFRGTDYLPQDPSNYVVALPDNLTLSTNMVGSQIVFLPGSGDISNYDPNQDHITITDSSSGESTAYHFNQYGVIVSP